jgi:hypothetical protein
VQIGPAGSALRRDEMRGRKAKLFGGKALARQMTAP